LGFVQTERPDHEPPEKWVHANADRIENEWQMIVELGYALPHEPAGGQEAA
jgi:hypothetical protein